MKKLTLEEEFEKFKDAHKYNIIATSLIVLEDKGIYKLSPILESYNRVKEKGEDKAFMVADELYDNYVNGDTKEYDEIYEMCWKKIRNRLSDKCSYHLDEEV